MTAGPHIFPRWQIHAAAAALFLALSVGGYLLGLRPAIADAALRQAHARELAERHRRAVELDQSLGQLKAQLSRLREDLDASPLRLQPADQINRRLADITRIATSCHLQFTQVQPGTLRAGRRHAVVPIELAGSGTYITFARFLRALHETNLDIGVSAFQITANPSQPGEPAAFRCQLLWYVQPPLDDKRAGR